MIEPITAYECAGVWVEIVQDIDPADPQDSDNAGTIYSWADGFDGDESISEPTEYGHENGTWCPPADLLAWFGAEHPAALTLLLRFSDYGSNGARIFVSDDPNCAICFTQEELDREWKGSVEDATRYAEARVAELDDWFQGNVWGIVVRDREGGEVMDSVWGFTGEPTADYIKNEAIAMAEAVAADIEHERELVQEWAARGVTTVTA